MAEVEIKVKIDGVEYTQDQLKGLADGAKKAGKEVKDLGKKTKDAGEEATIFTDIKKKFSDMTGGIRKVIGSFKTLRGAIAATGIGALVLALGTLIEYFRSSEEGSRKLAIATETLQLLFGKLSEFAQGVGETIVNAFSNPLETIKKLKDAIVNNLIERFKSLLEVLGFVGKAFKQFFTGDFAGALDSVKEAGKEMVDVFTGVDGTVEKVATTAKKVFKEVKQAVEEAVETATRLVDATRSIRDQQQKLIVENAQLNKELEEQKKIAEDTTRAYDERKAALERVGEVQVQLADNLAKQAKAEEDLLKLQIQNESNYEKREELETQLAEATAARIEAETALSIVQLEASKLTTELELEELDRKRAINDQITALGLENIENARERAMAELAIAEETALAELELLRATEEEKQAVREGFAQLREKVNREQSLAEIDQAAATISAIGAAFEEGSGAFKAFKIVETIISTYSAAQKAYESAVAVPIVGPVLGPAAAAAAVAAGLKSVQAITQTEIPKAAYGGLISGPSHSGGGSLIEAEGGEFVINKYAMRQPGVAEIANSLNQSATPDSINGGPVLKTYVIAQEVTTAQEANTKIRNLARL